MYSAMQGRDYNTMEQNKENYNVREQKFSNDSNPFQTPQKMSRESFNRDMFQTPASNPMTPYGQRTGNSLTDTPIGKTNFKPPNENGVVVNVQLCRFEELSPLPSSITLPDIQAKIKQIFCPGNKSMWEAKFESITVLRTLNKYYPQEIFQIFNEFGAEIIQCFSSEICCIQKNILLFSLEVLSIEKNKVLDNRAVCLLVPCLLNRSVSSSKEVRDKAKDALLIISRDHISEASLTTLAKICKTTKHRVVRQFALRMLTFGIDTIQSGVSSFSEQSLAQIFVAYASLNEGKMDYINELCKGTASNFCNLMGFDNYTRFLKILLDHSLITMHQANEMVEVIKDAKGKLTSEQHRVNLIKTKQSCKKRTQALPVDTTQILSDTATKHRERQQSSGNGAQGTFFGSNGGYFRCDM